MTTDIQNLIRQKEELEQQISELRTSQKREAIEKVMDIMDEFGLSLSDLGASKKKSAVRIASKIRYRSPADPSKTWSGRGRRPQWVQDHVEAGNSIEELKVD